MNAKARYNALIAEIEAKACDRNSIAHDLMFSIARSKGIDPRDLNALIRFMTGDTLLNYIKSRKLMAAYKYLIESQQLDIESAIVISGFDNQSSFTKKFSAYFNLTPKEAFYKKDKSLYVEPLTWDTVSCDTDYSTTDTGESSLMKEVMRFGIPQHQYSKVIQAHELEELYGFSPFLSQLAFELSENLKISLREVFAFVDEIRDYEQFHAEDHADRLGEEVDLPRMLSSIKESAQDPYMQFMYFKCDIHPDQAHEMLYERFQMTKKEIILQDPTIIREFTKTGYMSKGYMPFDFFKAAYIYYMENANAQYSDEEYDEYIDLLHGGFSKEEAFDELEPFDMDEIAVFERNQHVFEALDEYYFNHPIERMAEEIEDCNGIRIDMDYDEDNPYYDD